MISAKRSRPALAQRRVGGEQVAHAELEVLEVDAGARRLGPRVGGAEALEQGVEPGEHRTRVVIGARAAQRLPGRAVLAALGGVEPARAVAQPRRRRGPRAAGRPGAARTRSHASSARQRLLHAASGARARERAHGRRARRRERRALGLGRRLRRRAPPGRAASGRGCAALRGRRAPSAEASRRRRRRRRPPRRPPPRPSRRGRARTRAAASRRAAASSSTTKRGSRPAASGAERSTRAQKPWIVPIHAPSAARASSDRPREVNRCRTRSRSSAAAFSVKVSARIAPTGTPSSSTGLDEALDEHGGLARAGVGGEQPRARALGDRRALLGREGRRGERAHRGGRRSGVDGPEGPGGKAATARRSGVDRPERPGGKAATARRSGVARPERPGGKAASALMAPPGRSSGTRSRRDRSAPGTAAPPLRAARARPRPPSRAPARAPPRMPRRRRHRCASRDPRGLRAPARAAAGAGPASGW